MAALQVSTMSVIRRLTGVPVVICRQIDIATSKYAGHHAKDSLQKWASALGSSFSSLFRAAR
jgi:hypothetical protein